MIAPYSDTGFAFDKTTLAILDSLPFGVYYCDTSLVVRYINQPYADYLGVRPVDVVGRKVTDFLPTTRAPQVIESGAEELYDESSVLCGKENQRILVNRIPLRNDRNEVIGFISQLISVGKGGWNTLWDKIEQAEQALQLVRVQSAEPSVASCDSQLIVGESPQILGSMELARFLAETDEPVLITGATGVGKELFANMLHSCSRRAGGPLISINCAAISREFIASELFGYAPGAFTGANRSGKAGQIEMASGGTLFLDEIGDLPLESQGSLLRVLETHQVQRLNATTGRHVDFRLISATNRDLKAMIAEGMFREDLFYRINALQLPVPPLAEREGDIPILVKYFQARFGKPGLCVDDDTMTLLERYSWPGNVRELRNTMTYAAVQAKYGHIRPQHLPPSILTAVGGVAEKRDSSVELSHKECDAGPAAASLLQSKEKTGHSPSRDASNSLAEHEREAIVLALKESRGNISKAAQRLGVSRTTLYKKIHDYSINHRAF